MTWYHIYVLISYMKSYLTNFLTQADGQHWTPMFLCSCRSTLGTACRCDWQRGWPRSTNGFRRGAWLCQSTPSVILGHGRLRLDSCYTFESYSLCMTQNTADIEQLLEDIVFHLTHSWTGATSAGSKSLGSTSGCGATAGTIPRWCPSLRQRGIRGSGGSVSEQDQGCRNEKASQWGRCRGGGCLGRQQPESIVRHLVWYHLWYHRMPLSYYICM
jgi:hypothetical protein